MGDTPAHASCIAVLRHVRMLGLAVIAALMLAHGVAAQTSGSAGTAAPTPASTAVGPEHKAGSEPGSGDICPALPRPSVAANPVTVVELDTDTLWRPRSSEVRVIVTSPKATIVGLRACFGWSGQARKNAPIDPQDDYWAQRPSPLVRLVPNADGKQTYGLTVPDLPVVRSWWPWRVLGNTPQQFTGLFAVPIANMHVIATVHDNSGDAQLSVVLPVGITSAGYSAMLLMIVLILAAVAMSRTVIGHGWVPRVRALLLVISSNDGRASLSQFQVLLWTFVVAGSAIYVMALSGNLIEITAGTLTLLGIAGAAGLLARIPPVRGQTILSPPIVAPAVPPPIDQTRSLLPNLPRAPRWSDMVVVDNGFGQQIDVTRVQMLMFTLISAAFVGIKVVTSYEIPAIPDSFLLLMGISNGVYLTGRHLAAQ